jgi:hypothetical protein
MASNEGKVVAPLSASQRLLLERIAAEPDNFVEVGDARHPPGICAAELASHGLVQLDTAVWKYASGLRAKITAKGRCYLAETPPSRKRRLRRNVVGAST